MPFLVVDYDQGMGGEFFCANLSRSNQCVPLEFTQFKNGRTKVYDKFNQEFLNTDPVINVKSAHDELYELILTHRHTKLAGELLKDVRSLRIATPIKQSQTWEFCKYRQIANVLSSRLPNNIFVGEVKILARDATNPNFLKEINSRMTNVELILISKNISPTKANKNHYIDSVLDVVEPVYDYDLIIKYDDLIFNTEKVKLDIFNKFSIEILGSWLDTYRQNYEAWLSPT
jgi:hypothetical protein